MPSNKGSTKLPWLLLSIAVLGGFFAAKSPWQDSVQALLAAIPDLAKAVVVVVTVSYGTFKVVVRHMMWWRRRQLARQYTAPSASPNLPALDPKTPSRILVPPVWFYLDWIDVGFQQFRSFVSSRSPEIKELVKNNDDAEVHYTQALFRAAHTKGLYYVPHRYRGHIQLEIARQSLIEFRAPQEAIQIVQDEIAALDQNVLITAVFSQSTLQAVDMTPENGPKSNYFTKYLQPLMVTFSEDRFRHSAGPEQAYDEILIEHMKYVSERRVCAAFVEDSKSIADQLFGALPREEPKGPQWKNERHEARMFNKKTAAKGVLVVSTGTALSTAEALAQNIEMHLRRASNNFIELADEPEVVAPEDRICFLWHQAAGE